MVRPERFELPTFWVRSQFDCLSRPRKKGCCDLDLSGFRDCLTERRALAASAGGPEDSFRARKTHLAPLAYVARIARFRMRTRL